MWSDRVLKKQGPTGGAPFTRIPICPKSSKPVAQKCPKAKISDVMKLNNGEPIKDDYVLETTPSDLIFIDTSAPSLDGLFLETTPSSDTFFQTTPESDYLYIDTSPPSGIFSISISNSRRRLFQIHFMRWSPHRYHSQV